LKTRRIWTSSCHPASKTPAPPDVKNSTPLTTPIPQWGRSKSQLDGVTKHLLETLDGTEALKKSAPAEWTCLCGNKWPISKKTNRCNQPCLKWRPGARENAKWGPNKAKKDPTKIGSKLKTWATNKRTAKDEEKKPKKKTRKVLHLRRKNSPMSQRKGLPRKIRAPTSALAKATEDGDSTSKFVPLVVNPVPYIDVTPRGVTNDVSPMTERQAIDGSSIGSTTSSTLTMI